MYAKLWCVGWDVEAWGPNNGDLLPNVRYGKVFLELRIGMVDWPWASSTTECYALVKNSVPEVKSLNSEVERLEGVCWVALEGMLTRTGMEGLL